MKRALFGCALCVSAALVASACGSDDGSKSNPNKLPPSNGGESGQGAAGEPNNTGNRPSGGSAGSSTAPGGAGGTPEEVQGGAGGETPAGNAGEPGSGGAAGEGGVGGAGSVGGAGGEGPTGNVLFASFGTKLVWIEPENGKLHEVGDMRTADGNTTYSEVVFAYGGVPGEAWVVTPRYQAATNSPPPQLGKLNLCTGVVSDLQTLTRASAAPKSVEGLALHPNGTWYISTGIGAQYVTNKLGTVNVATRVITDLAGTVDTVQDDMDSMVFVGTTLYGIDVATGNSRLDLVTANLATGAVTVVASPTSASAAVVPLRIAYDDSRSKVYAWRPSDRNLLELSLTTGVATPLGETHASNVYPGEPSQGFTVAPICP